MPTKNRILKQIKTIKRDKKQELIHLSYLWQYYVYVTFEIIRYFYFVHSPVFKPKEGSFFKTITNYLTDWHVLKLS
jgi:hypothetical protein